MRIRTIKPEFWANEHLARLPDFTILLAIGLLNYADDEGYFNANPSLIKASLFPLRERSGSVPVAVTELSNQGFIELFESDDGRTFGRVVNFAKHQVINKPYKSKLKEFCKTPVGLLHLYGSDTVALPSGTGNREQGMGTGNGKDSGAIRPSLAVAKPASISEQIAELSKNPAYAGINVGLEYSKLQAWCGANKKTPSYRRFVNWLNRAERPMPRQLTIPASSAPSVEPKAWRETLKKILPESEYTGSWGTLADSVKDKILMHLNK